MKKTDQNIINTIQKHLCNILQNVNILKVLLEIRLNLTYGTENITCLHPPSIINIYICCDQPYHAKK